MQHYIKQHQLVYLFYQFVLKKDKDTLLYKLKTEYWKRFIFLARRRLLHILFLIIFFKSLG